MLTLFLKYLQVEKGYSVHTVRSYGDDVQQFYQFCGIADEPPTTFTARHVRAWLSSMISQGVSTRSANRKLSSLRSYFRFLQRQGYIKINPVERVISPKSGKRLPVFVSEKEMKALLSPDFFSDDFTGIRDTTIIALFYFTGIRLSELISLTLDSIDYSSQTLKVLGKGGKERIIPLHPEIIGLIKKYIFERKSISKNKKDTSLFLTIKGKPLYSKLVYKIVNRHLAMVTTLEKKSPHVLRHTFATHLLNQGAELNAIKELLGHANLSATQVYTHSSFEKLKKAYNLAHPRA